LIVFIVFTSVLIADQLTKYWVRDSMFLGQSISFLGDVVRFTYVENPGIAFGIRVTHGWLFTILSILASIGIIYYLIHQWKASAWIKASLALILGGAIGNLVDRLRFAKVADFVDVGIGDVRWPVFNVADAAVVVGMFILFITLYLQEKKLSKSVLSEQ
jgi:signal peptidase II